LGGNAEERGKSSTVNRRQESKEGREGNKRRGKRD